MPTIVATGPLTSDALAADLAACCGRERLAFYDAIAPIVEADSVARRRRPDAPPGAAFFLSRWGKGEGADYLNCPLDREQYQAFVERAARGRSRRRRAASRTCTTSRAACPSRSWPSAATTPCASAR